MQIAQLFEVGSQWKHRERELLVFIRTVVAPGQFLLAFVNKGPVFEAIDMAGYILNGTWTAEELVRDFDPMPVRPTRYDHIHDDDLFDEEITPS